MAGLRNAQAPRQGLEKLAAKGRGGDTELSHTTKGELVVPLPIQKKNPQIMADLEAAYAEAGLDFGRYQVGGSDDSINPKTGMAEFDAEDSAGNNMSDNNNQGGGGPGNGSQGGTDGNEDRSWQETGTEIGPAHARDVNAAFTGDKAAMDRQGFGPSEIGGGEISLLGISPAQNYNPMTNEKVFGIGLNPGKAAGGLIGNMVAGPLGGVVGSWLGGKVTDTTMSFPDVTGTGYGLATAPGGVPGDGQGNYVYDPASGRVVFSPEAAPDASAAAPGSLNFTAAKRPTGQPTPGQLRDPKSLSDDYVFDPATQSWVYHPAAAA